MKLFRPERNLQFPIGRGGLANDVFYLEKGRTYVAASSTVERMSERESNAMWIGDCEETWTGDYSLGDILTILCPGGIGDMVVLRAVLNVMAEQYPGLRFHIASTSFDYEIFGDLVEKTSVYPLPMDVVEAYDYLVSIEDIRRQSKHQELFDCFAEILRVDLPDDMHDHFKLSIPDADRRLAAYRTSVPGDRPKVGIQLKSAAHYRSYPAFMNALVALELTDPGNRRQSDMLYDVFLLGSFDQRISWKRDGEACEPPPHVHDLCGVDHRFREMAAIVDQMDVMLCPDSAYMHIAAMLDVPTLALFSVTEGQTRTGYYSDKLMFIQGEAECAPCMNVASMPACGERFCRAMTSISPYYVADVIDALYQNGGQPDYAIAWDPERHGQTAAAG